MRIERGKANKGILVETSRKLGKQEAELRRPRGPGTRDILRKFPELTDGGCWPGPVPAPHIFGIFSTDPNACSFLFPIINNSMTPTKISETTLTLASKLKPCNGIHSAQDTLTAACSHTDAIGSTKNKK